MSWVFLAGVPKRVKDIYDTLAAVTFSNLDTTVSSRASSTEVAKAADWTSALATKLNTNCDTTISGVNTNVGQVYEAPVSLQTAGPQNTTVGLYNDITSAYQVGCLYDSTSATSGYDTHLSDSGRGFLTYLLIAFRNASGSTAYNYGARITWDGSTGNAFSNVGYSIPASAYRILCFAGLGGVQLGTTMGVGFIPGTPMRYTSQITIESYGSNANVQRKVLYAYVPTS